MCDRLDQERIGGGELVAVRPGGGDGVVVDPDEPVTSADRRESSGELRGVVLGPEVGGRPRERDRAGRTPGDRRDARSGRRGGRSRWSPTSSFINNQTSGTLTTFYDTKPDGNMYSLNSRAHQARSDLVDVAHPGGGNWNEKIDRVLVCP